MFHPRIYRGGMANESAAQDDDNLKKKRGGRKHKGSSLRRALQTPEHGQEPPDLAKLLWYSCGVAAVLLQCIASDPETRPPFLKAQLPLWVFPLIDTTEESEVYEYMR
ncbi:protein with Rcd1-like domain [Klebsormidium nitens]|uniref:Protein with Rcd1-like domain n=1 Tax=Klebsormidium nitens TaxID=105231 RepID=A0A1Y1IVS0_KLENI|nr:protein with Rcd1-like domain [Klebsormidium nitens]|eukprot:GAQ92368.1 protein with Rcd1-like domain [Klebsormidium nitens]